LAGENIAHTALDIQRALTRPKKIWAVAQFDWRKAAFSPAAAVQCRGEYDRETAFLESKIGEAKYSSSPASKDEEAGEQAPAYIGSRNNSPANVSSGTTLHTRIV
jgi:hypothetical protein